MWRGEVDFSLKSVRLLVFTAVLISKYNHPHFTDGETETPKDDWHKVTKLPSVTISGDFRLRPFDSREGATKDWYWGRKRWQIPPLIWAHVPSLWRYPEAPLGGTLVAAGDSWLLLPWGGPSADQWHHHHLGVYEQREISGPLLDLWNLNLHCNRIPW